MKFTYTYICQPSYSTLFSCMVCFAILIGVSFVQILFIIPTIVFIFLFYNRVFCLKNKLMIGMNAEGVCIWQKDDQYLFCTLASIKKIEVRKFRVRTRSLNTQFNYLYIEYGRGVILSVSKPSTYSQPEKEVDLEIISTMPSFKKQFSFYIPFEDVKRLESKINTMPINHAKLDIKDPRKMISNN